MRPPDCGHRRHRVLPPRRVADPDRARDRLGLLDAMAEHERRRALGLEAEHLRRLPDLLEALPVGRDVAGVADRDAQPVDLAELLVDLERGRLLALEPERVDRVDERDRVAAGELADDLERLVEVAAQRDDARAVHQRLGELARGDLALGTMTAPPMPGPRGVGGQRRGGVARRRADDRLGAVAHGVGHRARHAAVLERARRVRALELQPDLGAGLLADRPARGRAGSSPRRATRPGRPRRTAGGRGSAR